MKTKTTTLAAICMLGFIGTINVNAANYKNANNNVLAEEGKSTNVGLVALAEKTSSENETRFETGKFLLNVDAEAAVDFEKEAQLITKWVVDLAEAKVMNQIIADEKFVEVELAQSPLDKVAEADIDLFREAQLANKLIVDEAEAKIIKKLTDDGKLVEFN